jgi:hypothetical protein
MRPSAGACGSWSISAWIPDAAERLSAAARLTDLADGS